MIRDNSAGVVHNSFVANNNGSIWNGNQTIILPDLDIRDFVNVSFINCTISSEVSYPWNGFRVSGETNVVWINSIINSERISVQYQVIMDISYSLINYSVDSDIDGEVNYLEGVIEGSPLFTDPDNGDFTLQPSSPCIDAGDPDSEFDPDSTIADMGAFYYDQIENPLIYGCIDPYASNYDESANADDGSCEYNPYVETVWDEMYSILMAFYINSASIDGNELENGDEIGVMDDGLCIGVIRPYDLEGTPYQLFVPADNPTTPEVDGYTAGTNS
jgi:hypothetical protein